MSAIKIVSSYSDSCGNAYFTKVLENDLRKLGHDCACAELNLEFTQSIVSNIRKKANKHIEQLCEEIAEADGCNIQMEAGLFGTFPADIVSRVKRLVSANKNVSVTLHSPRLFGDSASSRDALKSLLAGNLKLGLSMLLSAKKNNIHLDINRRIIKFLVDKSIPMIVHTNRAKRQIFNLYGYDNVVVHPLKFVSPGYQVNVKKIQVLRQRYGIDDGAKIIGMFGFVNEYKGHTLALKALEALPSDYKLFIFGRVHPQTIKSGAIIDSYLSTLHSNILKMKLSDRVFFVGETQTDDFIDYSSSVDHVWLPYAEVGQDGSGIASICLDVSRSVCASTSFAFDELLQLIPYPNVQRFDIGNYMELAQKTMFPPALNCSANEVKNMTYSTESQAKMYAKTLGFS